jgi:protoporphyrinogen oxidase
MVDLRRLLGPDLLKRRRNGRIRLLGRYVKFPLDPVDLFLHLPPSFIAGVARDSIVKLFNRHVNSFSSFADALLAGLGPTICRNFYFPYARKLWGLDPEKIAVEQAQRRVSANSLSKLARKALALVPGLKPPGAGIFYYPRRGYGQISNALAERVKHRGGAIFLSTRVQEIRLKDGRPTNLLLTPAVERQEGSGTSDSSPSEIRTDFVLSTIPITTLAGLLRPEAPGEIRKAYGQLRYRGMMLFYIILNTDRFTPYDAHYFPEEEVIFSRISEPKNYSESTEPRGLTGLCVEVPCDVGDRVWASQEEQISDRVLEDMRRVGLPVDSRIKSTFMRRLSSVYPIYDKNFSSSMSALEDYISRVPGLVSLGRQGLFAHDNTHHTMEMAYRADACLNPALIWNAQKWKRYREEFKSHVVED